MAEEPLGERRLPDHRIEALRMLGRSHMVKKEGDRFQELWKAKSLAKTLEEISHFSEETESDESARETKNEDIVEAFEEHLAELKGADFGSKFREAFPVIDESEEAISQRFEKITGRKWKPPSAEADASDASRHLFQETFGPNDAALLRGASEFVKGHLEKFHPSERRPLTHMVETLDWAIKELKRQQ